MLGEVNTVDLEIAEAHSNLSRGASQFWIELIWSVEVMKSLIKTVKFAYGALRKSLTNPSQAILLLRMAWWVTVLSLATRWRPLPTALKLVSGPESKAPLNPDTELPNRLAKTIDALLATDVLFFQPICWKRAAVLRRFLSSNGINTKILFGVRNEKVGEVKGHAWLEVEGKPFLEATPPDYVVTYSFPSEQRFDPKLAVISVE